MSNAGAKSPRTTWALFDPEPGLVSWAAFEAFSAVAIAQATRRGESLSVLISQVEGAGGLALTGRSLERALHVLAGVVHRSVRSGDLIARHGPRSLAVVLPSANEVAALSVATRVRVSYAAAVESAAKRGKVVLAQGIATTPQSGSELDLLLDEAEAALVRASGFGRSSIGSAGRRLDLDAAATAGEAQPPSVLDELTALCRTMAPALPAGGAALERLRQEEPPN
jgi:diguanylate cyclase (GGDEF)-like protein